MSQTSYPPFDLQGHRGARGLRPENTLPSFEAAVAAGVTSIETDLHLTADGAAVLYHDFHLGTAAVADLTLAQATAHVVNRNPDPERFPRQVADATPAAARFATAEGFDPFALPSLERTLRFLDVCGGGVRLDLEWKWRPFATPSDDAAFRRRTLPTLLRILDEVRDRHPARPISVRSFDHRIVRALTRARPGLAAGVLVAETAPVDPAALARRAGADTYCPDYRFLDERQVRQCHRAGVRVVPWTVNDADAWKRLLSWGVDGITTDDPDRLATVLRAG